MENRYYITRREDLMDHGDASEISLQEWTSFVSKDPDMQLEDVTTVTLADGTQFTYPSPGRAIWFYREPGQSQPNPIVFDYHSGNIVVVNADIPTVKKIQHIAFKLNTKIFRETEKDTGQQIVEEHALAPRFTFSTMMAPLKKLFAHLGHSIQHSFFSLFDNSPEKLIHNGDDQLKDQ